MRRIATFVVSAIGLGLTMCPMAQADPLSYQDSVYTKWLSEIGVNYQNRVTTEMMIAQARTTCAMLDQNPTPQSYQAAVNRLVGGPGNFTKKEADGTVQAAVHSYCDAHSNLIYS